MSIVKINSLGITYPVSFSAGTASLPSITFSGDTNTGVFSPTADTIAFTEGGAEAMRIDSDGEVGIGTTSPNTKLQVSIGSNGSGAVNALRLDNVGTTAGDGAKLLFTAGGSTDGAGIAGLGQAVNSANLVFFSGGSTERMRIDSSGQVGIGTTPSNTMLSVKKNTTTAISQLNQENSSTFAAAVVDFLCARNTTNSSYFFLNCTITGVQTKLSIADSGNVTNINNSYGAISDQKLKENIIDASSQWEDIKNIPVRKFSFKTDNLQTPNKIGVIAQELEALGMSGLVEETYDDIRDTNKFLEDGKTPNPNYWNIIGKSETEKTKQVKYSVLYMKAIKALQEAMERIEQLEARLTVLESK